LEIPNTVTILVKILIVEIKLQKIQLCLRFGTKHEM